MFHFTDHFVSAIGSVAADVQFNTRAPKTKKQMVKAEKPATPLQVKQFIGDETGKSSSLVRQKWEILYQRFLRSRNTSNLGKKARYVEEILREFSGRIPLEAIVDDPRRKELSKKLFDKTNDFNFVIYPLGMGLWVGALAYDDEHLVLIRPDFL